MAYDELLAEEVRKALSGQRVVEKRVFGGLAFMVSGKMCVSVNNRPDHVMMVRIDPQNAAEYIKRKGARLAVMRGREMPGWIFLTQEAIRAEQDFDFWIQQALRFNRILTK